MSAVARFAPRYSLFPNGSDVGGQCAAGVRAAPLQDSIPQSCCDAEFDRFARVAQPMPGGGWFDPVNGSAEMPSGVPIEDWRAIERDFAHMGQGSAKRG